MTSENNQPIRICLIDRTSKTDIPGTRWSVWREVLLQNFTEVYVVSSENTTKKFTSTNQEQGEEVDTTTIPQIQVAFIHFRDRKIWEKTKLQKPDNKFWFWFSSETMSENLNLEIGGLPICRTTDLKNFNVTQEDIKGVINYITGKTSESERPSICYPRKPSDPDYDWHLFENQKIETADERKEARQEMFEAFSYLIDPPKKE